MWIIECAIEPTSIPHWFPAFLGINPGARTSPKHFQKESKWLSIIRTEEY